MAVLTFYDPVLVGQLAACGITARRRPPESRAPAAGFLLESRRAPARARSAATNVVAVHGNVTITGTRLLAAPAAVPAIATEPSPQTALELVEECARLRRDNQRLASEVDRLRAEVTGLTAGAAPTPAPASLLDDTARRFALLELD